MADYVIFGDTEGTLGDRSIAGGQTLFGSQIQYDTAEITGDAGSLTDRSVGGDDRILSLLAVTMTLTGDATSMTNQSQGGNDVIAGLSGLFNTLYGDARIMSDRARGGDDFLSAPAPLGTRTAATSDLYGDAFTLEDRATGGNDTLIGAKGFEGSVARLYGDGYELLDRATGGNDRLESFGYATDEMWGDAFTVQSNAVTGNDTFVFTPWNGRDIIHDFERGKDVIDLSAFAAYGVTDFDLLSNLIHEQPDGTLIILDLAGVLGNSVFVAGVTGLTAADFLLG